MFYLLVTLAVVLAVCAGIVATRRPAVALLQFAPAFAALGMALTLTGHRNVLGSAALLACCAALMVAAGLACPFLTRREQANDVRLTAIDEPTDG